jgi:hypothetical protein
MRTRRNALGLLSAVMWGLLTCCCPAAQISIPPNADRDGVLVLSLTGAIAEGDDQRLEKILSEHADYREPIIDSKALLFLNSDGGDFLAGIDLAKAIKKHAVATYVTDQARCVSACAVAFLGGSGFHALRAPYDFYRRMIAPGARVGFHAPYLPQDVLEQLGKGRDLQNIENIARYTITALEQFFREFNVSPLVLPQIANLSANEFFYLATVEDLFLFRVNLPELDSASLGEEARLREACRKLLAYRQGRRPSDAQYLPEGAKLSTQPYDNGRRIRGFELDDSPYRTTFCGRLEPQRKDDREEVHLFRQGRSKLEIVATFFNEQSAWSNAVPMTDENNSYVALEGGLDYWYFADKTPLKDLATFVRPGRQPLNMNLVLTRNSVESQEEPSIESRMREFSQEPSMASPDRFRDLSIKTANSIYALAKDHSRTVGGTRVTALTPQIELREDIAKPEQFEDEIRKIGRIEQRRVAYRRVASKWFAASHTTTTGFRYVAGFNAKDRSAIVQVLITKPPGEPLLAREKQLIEDIACSINFAGTTLPCGAKQR